MGRAMDTLGRDDELRAIHAFLDRPAPAGMAALVLEGEAGIGKSTLWLAGVEAARERGLRVLSSRPAEVELGVAHAALGDLLEDALADVLPELCRPHGAARSKPRCCIEDAPDEPVDARTLAVAVRNALQLLAERRADAGRDRRRPVARRLVRERAGVRGEAIAGAERPPSPRPPARGRHSGVGARACARRPQARARAGRPAQPGRAARDPAATGSAGRSRGRRCCACTKHRAGTRSSRSSSHAPSATNVDPTQPLPVPETLEALVRARLDGLPDETRASAAARLRARPAEARTAGR